MEETSKNNETTQLGMPGISSVLESDKRIV